MKSNVKKSGKKKKQITLVVPEKPGANVAPAEPTPTIQKNGGYTELAAQIAEELGETQRFPRTQIKHVLWALGATQTQALVARAKEIHAGEGLMIPSGTRKRTLGGIFFFLAYSEGQPKEGRQLKRPNWKPRVRAATPVESADAKE